MTGKLTVVGIGGGGGQDMTLRAEEALKACDVIAGYNGYVSLVRDDYPGKEFLSTGMCGEEERCRLALEKAVDGKNVAMVCSGDPGIYGMAGLCLELNAALPEPVEIEVVPGVTAACSGAALLGAPLGHDFAVISLSDLLTPWEMIEKRLRVAAQGDFVVCLYNPASLHREDYLSRACEILLETKSPETVCGMARQIGREGESLRVLTLRELRDAPADMFTMVFVGNSRTRALGGRMVTPRGYPLHE